MLDLCSNFLGFTIPKGSKYHYSRYFGPKRIYYTITWTLWDRAWGSQPSQPPKPEDSTQCMHQCVREAGAVGFGAGCVPQPPNAAWLQMGVSEN